MKNSLTFILLTVSVLSFGQNPCEIKLSNSRPDTITRFVFIDTTVNVKDLKEVKAISNNAFQTRQLIAQWIPIKTQEINVFIGNTIKSNSLSVSDTLTAIILRKYYTVLLLHSDNKNYSLLCFQSKNGAQDVFFIKPRLNKSQPQSILNFIEAKLQ